MRRRSAARSAPPLGRIVLGVLSLLGALLALAVACATSASAAVGPAATAGPLAANGFASPVCQDPAVLAAIGEPSRSNCAASGIAVAREPIGNYEFDVHADTGPLGTPGVDGVLQDLVLKPLWNALVWLVHALIVALEWCYSLDLTGGGALDQIGGALRAAQSTFTRPWLALVLAIAAVLLAYDGIVRRRVAESLGQAAATVAMIVAGLWLIADPAGTVGQVSRVVNEASLGTLAAVDSGTPNHAERTFAGALEGVFRTTITGPWCYLEFGDVAWCRDPQRLDPRLRAAAARIAALDRTSADCRRASGVTDVVACAAPGSGTAAALRVEANQLEQARTNGDVFLAIPANGSIRNSISDERSLLRAICQSPDMSACSGPAAAAAQFRTASGTWPRAGGLLFIAIGIGGTLALLGFIGLRLLAAALLSVLYLLLAPLAVLAPALGERGRGVFRTWSARLLGALVSKLVYSVLLGVTLLTLRVLLGLQALGWWTQWLLIAAFWWIVYAQRHELLAHVFGHEPRRVRSLPPAPGARGMMQIARASLRRARLPMPPDPPDREPVDKPPAPPTPAPRPPAPPQGERREHLEGDAPPNAADRADRADPHATPTATPDPDPPAPGRDAPAARRFLDDQVDRTLTIEAAEATALLADAHPARRSRDERIQRLDAQLLAAGVEANGPRGVSLRLRRERLSAERDSIDGTERLAAAAVQDAMVAERRRRDRSRELDRQASLPRGAAPGAPNAGPERRDYAALSGLAGLSQSQYERLAPGAQLRTRLAIDRELEQRRGLNAAAETAAQTIAPARRPRRQRQFTREEFDELVG